MDVTRSSTGQSCTITASSDITALAWALRQCDRRSGETQVLMVSVTSPQEITHLTAHIISPSTGAEVTATDDFVLRSGTATTGVWATRETIKLDELDFYSVDVDVTAADGTQVTADSVGHLTYLAQTIFDPLTANREAVSYAHRDVVVRGRVLSRSPRTRELTPFAGAPLYLNFRTYGRNDHDDIGWKQLTSGADGRFSHALTLAGAADFYADYPYQNEFPGNLSGQSATLKVPVKQSPVRLTATVDPRRLNAGGQITVTGQATWKSPTGWRPLSGAHLIIGEYYPGWAQADTGADGRYSASFVPYQSTDIPVTYVVEDPFIADASVTTKVIVVQPSLIREFTADRGAEAGTIEVAGALEFPGPISPGDPRVDIEFSKDGTTWARKATIPGGNRFSGTVPAKRPGYWRAHYRGGTEFQPFIGEAVYADPR
jgi:hypothetical protein